VANRDTWTVTAVGQHGNLTVTPTSPIPGNVTPAGVTPVGSGQRALPADYIASHVELAYASTAHGVQGDTVTTAHMVVGERTGAAAAYVGMTRGRVANTAHLVAADPADAREQWIAACGRDRADLGPAHAAQQAAAAAARYSQPHPLNEVLTELQRAWSVEQRCVGQLALWEPQRDILLQVVTLEAGHAEELSKLDAAYRRTALAAQRATQQAEASGAVLADEVDRIRGTLLTAWNGERDAACAAARVVLDGPGRLGLRRAAVARAGQQLTDWADRWRPHLLDLPTEATQIARADDWFDDRPALWEAFDTAARRTAERDHPEHADLRAAADTARYTHEQARRALAEAHRQREERLDPFGPIAWEPDPTGRLADLERDLAATHQQLTDVRARIAALAAEPALVALAPDRLVREREEWCARRHTERGARWVAAAPTSSPRSTRSVRPPEPIVHPAPRPGPGPGIGR
jgi:exodeoxyribonuclease V alpha subunit